MNEVFPDKITLCRVQSTDFTVPPLYCRTLLPPQVVLEKVLESHAAGSSPRSRAFSTDSLRQIGTMTGTMKES